MQAQLAATIVNCQIGFINVLVRPLLLEWASFLGAEAERDVVVTLEATLRLWETSGAKVIDSWGDFAKLAFGGAAETPVVLTKGGRDTKKEKESGKGRGFKEDASKSTAPGEPSSRDKQQRL